MSTLITAYRLDAQADFLDVAGPMQADRLDERHATMNHPGWVIAHVVSAQARQAEVVFGLSTDAWIEEWRGDTPRADARAATDLDDARDALRRVFATTTPLIEALTGRQLDQMVVGGSGDLANVTVAWAMLHGAAHLYVHASELNVIGVAMGLAEHGFPGKLGRARAVVGPAG